MKIFLAVLGVAAATLAAVPHTAEAAVVGPATSADRTASTIQVWHRGLPHVELDDGRGYDREPEYQGRRYDDRRPDRRWAVEDGWRQQGRRCRIVERRVRIDGRRQTIREEVCRR